MRMILSLLLMLLQFIAQLCYACIKGVYLLLKTLRIRVFALYLCVCGIVQLIWKPFSTGKGLALFCVGLGVCLLITVCSWISAFRRQSIRRKREEEERRARKQEKEAKKRERRLKKQKAPPAPTAEAQVYPTYFEVEGRPGYVFAEYADRYELYYRDQDRMVYIRTDPKKEEQN